MKRITYSLEDVPNVVKQILADFPNERIFLLQGTLGAGKTTLIKAFCEALGVASDLSSPSFSIINEYADKNGNTIAFHADLYRLKSAQEAEAIGFHEYLDSGKYCFIEWFEIIEDYVSGTKLSIEILADEKREITID
ncbi:MAG TPA: tRNA (adenosine(37)-N6)-threonylcarbamoyltransferase complex ATPase subunit type 1 TsaE [Chitinophagales bacterium]